MAVNRGKAFENIIKEAFQKIPGVSVDRIHDQMNGYAGSANISDFIIYKKPYEYYIECKTTHGNTFPFTNISDNQWRGLLEKSKIEGVKAGVIVWWCDKDVTKYIPIELLQVMRDAWNMKSVRYDYEPFDKDTIIIPYFDFITIQGKKKRIFWDYDMTTFFKEVENEV